MASIVDVLRELWGDVVWVISRAWGWGIAAFLYALGVNPMFGDQYFVAIGLYLTAIAIAGFKLRAEAKVAGKKGGLFLALIIVAVILSLLWVKHTHEILAKQPDATPQIFEWLRSHTGFIYGQPWRWILGGVAVGFLLTSIVNVVRRRKELLESGPSDASEQRAEELSRLNKLHETTLEQIKSQYAVAHESADLQASRITDFVELVRACTNDPRLDAELPTLRWGLRVKNRSVFRIELDGEVGPLYFEGHKLTQPKEIKETDLAGLSPDAEGSIVFLQQLSLAETEMLKRVPEGKFEFDKVQLKFKGHEAAHVTPRGLIILPEFRAKLGQCSDLQTQATATIRAENDSLKSEITKLSEGRLSLAIKTKQPVVPTTDVSHLQMYEAQEGLQRSGVASFRLHFDNRSSVSNRICRVWPQLLRLRDGKEEPVPCNASGLIIQHNGNPENINLEDTEIPGGKIIGPYCLSLSFTASIDDLEEAFFRVTLEALRQSNEVLEFDVDWEDAMNSHYAPLLPRSLGAARPNSKPQPNIVLLGEPRRTFVSCDEEFVFRECLPSPENRQWAIVVDFQNQFEEGREIKGLNRVLSELTFSNAAGSHPIHKGFWLGQKHPEAAFERGQAQTLLIGYSNEVPGIDQVSIRTFDRRYEPPAPINFSPYDLMSVRVSLFTQNRHRFHKECELELTPSLRVRKPFA